MHPTASRPAIRTCSVLLLIGAASLLHSAAVPCTAAAHGSGQESPPAPAPSDPDAESPEVRAFIARADELIADRNYDAKSTAHYTVKTDDPRLNVAEAAQLLEAFRSYFDAFWSPRAELRPYDGRSRIYLFYSKYEYKQLFGEGVGPDVRVPFGHYQLLYDIVAVHTDTVGLSDLPDVLVHEAAHQLMQKRLLGEAVPPPWVNEGLASYFGYTLRDGSGSFQTGRIGGKGVSFFKKAPPGRAWIGWEKVRSLRERLKSGDALPPGVVVSTQDPIEFHDALETERYTVSWMLAHFLFHAAEGSRAAGFVRYLLGAARGDAGTAALLRQVGMGHDELEAAFREYVLHLKAR